MVGEGASIMDRRRFLTISGVAAAGWTRLKPVSAASSAGGVPPGFPSGVQIGRERFENWSGEIVVDDLWTVRPQTVEDLVRIVNWAADAGWRVRPRGQSHNWSPIVVSSRRDGRKAVVVDMTAGFSGAEMVDATSVRVKTGTSMKSLLRFLEDQGCGVTSCPAPGDLSVGGVLAIDGHGTGVRAEGEGSVSGQTWGTMSNRILELVAIVWDDDEERYVARRFDRRDPGIDGLLVGLGRTLLVEAVLRVEPNHNLRCESWTSISGDELFGPPGSGGRLFADFLAESGRLEAIWYPFTANPWLKVWTVEPNRPFWSRRVDSPYNYAFSDNLSDEATQLVEDIVAGSPGLTPTFGGVMYAATVLGLTFEGGYDIWGASKNLLLYVRPTTLRVTANGYAIVTRRSNVQRVLHEFVQKYDALVETYRDRGEYPINGPMEIRVTGLDHASDVELDGARPAALSAVRPDPDHPDFDVAVWLDLLTLPGTPSAGAFYTELEEWLFDRYNDDEAMCRVEWSKGWGYTVDGPWRSKRTAASRIPASIGNGFGRAVVQLQRYDPRGVFRCGFHDVLMPERPMLQRLR